MLQLVWRLLKHLENSAPACTGAEGPKAPESVVGGAESPGVRVSKLLKLLEALGHASTCLEALESYGHSSTCLEALHLPTGVAGPCFKALQSYGHSSTSLEALDM